MVMVMVVMLFTLELIKQILDRSDYVRFDIFPLLSNLVSIFFIIERLYIVTAILSFTTIFNSNSISSSKSRCAITTVAFIFLISR